MEHHAHLEDRRGGSGLSPGTVRRLADDGELPFSLTQRGHRRFNEADVLAYRVARTTGDRPAAGTRAEVWRAAVLALLTEAQADLGATPDLARPFGAAAEQLRHPS